jgi:hypothetical protein
MSPGLRRRVISLRNKGYRDRDSYAAAVWSVLARSSAVFTARFRKVREVPVSGSLDLFLVPRFVCAVLDVSAAHTVPCGDTSSVSGGGSVSGELGTRCRRWFVSLRSSFGGTVAELVGEDCRSISIRESSTAAIGPLPMASACVDETAVAG